MHLTRQNIEDAEALCKRLVLSQMHHDKLCKDPRCRLIQKPKAQDKVGAAVLNLALRDVGMGRQFGELADYLKVEDVSTHRAEIGKICKLCDDHITASRAGHYPCIDGYKAPEQTSAGDGKVENTSGTIKGLLPRLCGDLKLPFIVQRRAGEIIEDWSREGLRSLMPQTWAACALFLAHREHEAELREAGGRGLDINDLATASGMERSTILRGLKEKDPEAAASIQQSASAAARGAISIVNE